MRQAPGRGDGIQTPTDRREGPRWWTANGRRGVSTSYEFQFVAGEWMCVRAKYHGPQPNEKITNGIDNLTPWLTTVVSRVRLDMLRSRASRGQELAGHSASGEHEDSEHGGDPEEEAVLLDSVGRALLVGLNTLQPAERIARHRRGGDRRLWTERTIRGARADRWLRRADGCGSLFPSRSRARRSPVRAHRRARAASAPRLQRGSGHPGQTSPDRGTLRSWSWV